MQGHWRSIEGLEEDRRRVGGGLEKDWRRMDARSMAWVRPSMAWVRPSMGIRSRPLEKTLFFGQNRRNRVKIAKISIEGRSEHDRRMIDGRFGDD